jgi:hypothetical protein
MKALFSSVKQYAVFAARPHLFRTGEPYQLGANCANGGVYVELVSGKESNFRARVEQFGGVILAQ